MKGNSYIFVQTIKRFEEEQKTIETILELLAFMTKNGQIGESDMKKVMISILIA